MAKESLAQKFFKDGVSNAVWNGLGWLATIGSPWGVAAVTAISGAAQQLPVAYIIAATTVAGAMTATLLLRFDEWRARSTAANKLTYAQALLAFEYTRDQGTGAVTGLEFVQPLLILVNGARFPISFIVGDMAWSVDGRVTNEALAVRSGLIPAQSMFQYRLPRISLDNMPPKQRMEGRLKFSWRYGKPGRERYELAMHLNMIAQYDIATSLYGDQTALNVVE